jgi:ring-1,2-phenylacetyl-CoA epoxidase subunit PaaE
VSVVEIGAARGRRGGPHRLRVSGIERLCDDAVAVRFDVPPELDREFRFRAGQSVALRRMVEGRDERRTYSLCSPPGEGLRIGVRAIPGGLFSTWLTDEVRPGDEVEVFPPAGSFTPDVGVPAHHVLLCAGSGITPGVAIAAAALRVPGSRVTLLYGNRRSSTVMFADELADLKDRYPSRLAIHHFLSREQQDAQLLSGRLDADKLELVLDTVLRADDVDHWWLCGPLDMVEAARAVLRARGVPADEIHRELFYVDDPPPEVSRVEAAPSGPTSEVSITLDGRTSVLRLPRELPILEGAQHERNDLPFACRGGVCGTCRARLVEGEVKMRRNFALSPEEVEAGFVLTCQSLPQTDRVAVDYDA